LYEAAEHKILNSLKSHITKSSHEQAAKRRRKTELSTIALPRSVQERSLPFPVLQGILKCVQLLQSSPEERILHLKCDSGISTVVVWCHHVLRLSLIVRFQGREIRFGDGAGNIVVEETDTKQAGASLLDPKDQHEPLFSLINGDTDLNISSES